MIEHAIARRLRSILLAVAVAAVAVFATAGAATAEPAGGSTAANDCPLNALCLYDGVDFTGALFTVAAVEAPGVCVSLVEHGWGDRARSVVNTHSMSAAMFHNDDCNGGPFQVPPNSSRADLGMFAPQSVWVAF